MLPQCVVGSNFCDCTTCNCAQVRRSVDKISLGMALELVEGIDWGMRTPKIPSGEAKDRSEVLQQGYEWMRMPEIPGEMPQGGSGRWNGLERRRTQKDPPQWSSSSSHTTSLKAPDMFLMSPIKRRLPQETVVKMISSLD
eukprot:1160443-Pelagomonas_calceolata.AAC.14